MFKEFINSAINSAFNRNGQTYRTLAILRYDEALHSLNLKKQFEKELDEAGYRINGGFIELKHKND